MKLLMSVMGGLIWACLVYFIIKFFNITNN